MDSLTKLKLRALDCAILATGCLVVGYIHPTSEVKFLLGTIAAFIATRSWMSGEKKPKEEPPVKTAMILPIIRSHNDEILFEIREEDGHEIAYMMGFLAAPTRDTGSWKNYRDHVERVVRLYMNTDHLTFEYTLDIPRHDAPRGYFFLSRPIKYAFDMSQEKLDVLGIKRMVWGKAFTCETRKGWFIQDAAAMIPVYADNMMYFEGMMGKSMISWALKEDKAEEKVEPLVF